jgi:G:T/U-mismatch repair DNA glycosylase
MSIKTENNYSKETHPWSWHIPVGATILFIGTFPTEKRNRKHDFFYSSSTNRFWEIMFEVAKPLNAIQGETDEVKKRKLILEKLKLGLTDMGRNVLRQQGSSNDHSLFPLDFIDITQVISEHQTIKTIVLTGSSQGNSSLSWFGIFCSINKIQFDAKKIEEEKSGTVLINNHSINVKSTYSPSRLSRVKTEVIIEVYKSLIL